MAAGRRPGSPDTRGEIVAAARAEFAVHGFAATSLRAVARRASVDPALVHHYFRDKADLADAAIVPAIDVEPFLAPVLAAPLERTGEALVESLVRAWDDPSWADAVTAAMRIGVGDVEQAGLLRALLTDGPIPVALRDRGLSDVAVCTAMSHVLGMMAARYVSRLEPLASMPRSEVVALHGPLVQQCLAVPVALSA